jgi:hypothetical protein
MKSFFHTILMITLLPGTTLYAAAAEVAPEELLPVVQDVLEQLDRLAKSCLESDSPRSASDISNPCEDFFSAIDGDVLLHYLNSCRSLEAWRGEFARRYQEENRNTIESPDSLRILVQIEYFCATDALTQRTQFVSQAYQELRLLQSANSLNARQSWDERQKEIQQHYLMERERARLLDSRDTVQQRQQVETQRQFEQLQLELLRQDIAPR